MRGRVLLLGIIAVMATAGPALAEASGSGGNGASAEGSHAESGNVSSSASVHANGGASVGVAQGNVSEGSSAGGSNNAGGGEGGASTGGGGAGGVSGVASPAEPAQPVGVEDGVVRQARIPSFDIGAQSTSASDNGSSALLTWALVAVIVVCLVVLYRRLPRPAQPL